MIDYYLHKHCCLMQSIKNQKETIRCRGCVWLNKKLNKCIFSVDYPQSVSLAEFKSRIKSVNDNQQSNLTETFRRFKEDDTKTNREV